MDTCSEIHDKPQIIFEIFNKNEKRRSGGGAPRIRGSTRKCASAGDHEH